MIVLAAASTSFADSIMCKSGVVATGDTKLEVQTRCGEPLSRSFDSSQYATSMETWRYAIGGVYRDFIFEAGKLDQIKDGGKVD